MPPTPDSYGKTEIMIGNWFEKRKNRDKIILATKVAGPGCNWIRGGGNNFTEKDVKKIVSEVGIIKTTEVMASMLVSCLSVEDEEKIEVKKDIA